ncbi:MAG: hypothetical protein K2J90_05305 [Lachnospiraceae bacterium]|nr:hypothetical protein [Lachnospiraceae bacterium]
MKTVLYFEWMRKRQSMLKRIAAPLVVVLVLFVLCTLVDALMPEFNKKCMKWPDMLRDFLCLKSWTRHLWFNVWQFFALSYPFYLICSVMKGVADSLAEEDLLETVVYLHNAGITRKTIFLGKSFVYGGQAFVCCASLLIVSVVFALILGSLQMALNMLLHYALLWLICLVYLAITLFMVSYRGVERISDDTVLAVLILPCLVSRLPALLQFFSDLLDLTGWEGGIADTIGRIANRIKLFTIVSPITWCWPDFEGTVLHFIFGAGVLLIMFTAGIFAYVHKN